MKSIHSECPIEDKVNRNRFYIIFLSILFSGIFTIMSLIISDLIDAQFKIIAELNQYKSEQSKITDRLYIDNYYVREGDIINDRNLHEKIIVGMRQNRRLYAVQDNEKKL